MRVHGTSVLVDIKLLWSLENFFGNLVKVVLLFGFWNLGFDLVVIFDILNLLRLERDVVLFDFLLFKHILENLKLHFILV